MNAELLELTFCKFASKQIRWLTAHGYFVETNKRDIPRITYKQIEDIRDNNIKVINLNQLLFISLDK